VPCARTAVALAFFAATAGIMLVLSLYAQYGLGYNALEAGLMLAPVAAGNVTGALLAMRLAPRSPAARASWSPRSSPPPSWRLAPR
jgi:hypothetical protein